MPSGCTVESGALAEYLEGRNPDLIVFQNLTFANAAYMGEVLRRFNCPIVLWTLREPVIDGGRLRLNSLTGAYSAANMLTAFGRSFSYVFGGAGEERVAHGLDAAVKAAKTLAQLRQLRIAAVGHTPQGFGFGRALDGELLAKFGAELVCVEARELIQKARGYAGEDCMQYLEKSRAAMIGLDGTLSQNLKDYARLYRAYSEFVRQENIGAIASRCWPDFFTDFGTPVCAVLSMLNDEGIAAACEGDIYGALSIWMGVRLSGAPVFFGDPVSLNEEENSITFWHCGAAACALAREDTGARVGVHPNRKIGPVMDFGCRAFSQATIFRVGRKPNGSFRFFLLRGEALDRPKRFTGASIVVRTQVDCRQAVEKSVKAGMEPHFAVIQGDHTQALSTLAGMLGMEVCLYE